MQDMENSSLKTKSRQSKKKQMNQEMDVLPATEENDNNYDSNADQGDAQETPKSKGARSRNSSLDDMRSLAYDDRSFGADEEEETGNETNLEARQLFERTPETQKTRKSRSEALNKMTADKRSSNAHASSVKKMDLLQKTVFTPVGKRNNDLLSSMNYTNEENFVQPKVLEIRIDDS